MTTAAAAHADIIELGRDDHGYLTAEIRGNTVVFRDYEFSGSEEFQCASWSMSAADVIAISKALLARVRPA